MKTNFQLHDDMRFTGPQESQRLSWGGKKGIVEPDLFGAPSTMVMPRQNMFVLNSTQGMAMSTVWVVQSDWDGKFMAVGHRGWWWGELGDALKFWDQKSATQFAEFCACGTYKWANEFHADVLSA